MQIDFTGKRAIVCGSTQGIGLAVANCLAEAGAHVTLLARNEDRLKEIHQHLPCKKDQIHEYLVADFSEPEILGKKVNEQIKNSGGFDILINNTGGPKAGPILNALEEEFKNAFNNHLLCNHVLMNCCVNYMKEKKFGRIVNIISTSVKQPLKGLGVSNTIRAAVANWSKTLSSEVAPFGITVNNVLPGATSTQRLEEIIKNKSSKNNVNTDAIVEEMINEIPAGRFARPEEIANAVAFLCSEQAAYITGINLPVDGGRTMCL
ncbi:MAG: SDR family oxidoreductase [Bacteroidota bacterium]|jgi:3-oxoacyl-[acyl-carrier protein] reductase